MKIAKRKENYRILLEHRRAVIDVRDGNGESDERAFGIDTTGVNGSNGKHVSRVHLVVERTDDVNVAGGGVETETTEGVAADEQISHQTVGAFISI